MSTYLDYIFSRGFWTTWIELFINIHNRELAKEITCVIPCIKLTLFLVPQSDLEIHLDFSDRTVSRFIKHSYNKKGFQNLFPKWFLKIQGYTMTYNIAIFSFPQFKILCNFTVFKHSSKEMWFIHAWRVSISIRQYSQHPHHLRS